MCLGGISLTTRSLLNLCVGWGMKVISPMRNIFMADEVSWKVDLEVSIVRTFKFTCTVFASISLELVQAFSFQHFECLNLFKRRADGFSVPLPRAFALLCYILQAIRMWIITVIMDWRVCLFFFFIVWNFLCASMKCLIYGTSTDANTEINFKLLLWEINGFTVSF